MNSAQTPRITGNLRAEMARRGITQQQVAEILGLSRAAVSRRLLGQSPISIDELFEITEHFGIDMASIIFAGTDNSQQVA